MIQTLAVLSRQFVIKSAITCKHQSLHVPGHIVVKFTQNFYITLSGFIRTDHFFN
jgi:hypothetical protein